MNLRAQVVSHVLTRCVCVCVHNSAVRTIFADTVCCAAGAVNKRLNLAKLGYKHVSTPATQQQHADNNIVMTTTTTTQA